MKVLKFQAVITNPAGVFAIMIIALNLRINGQAKFQDVIEEFQF